MERGHLFLLRLSVRADDMTCNVLDLGDTMETRKNEKPNLVRLALLSWQRAMEKMGPLF